MKDRAGHMRSAAMKIIALLGLHRSGEPVPDDLSQSADETAQGLLTVARHLAQADSEAEADDQSKH